jgi:hypothetical protein
MKVQRYNYGASNVQQRKEGRAALRTPEQAGAEAYAPYGAVADIAGAASGQLFRIAEEKVKEQEANDKILAASDVANVRTDLQLIRKQADQEKWSDEQFNAAVDEKIKGFVSGVDKISPRNREKTAFIYGNEAKNLLAESQLEAMDLRTDRTRETWAATYDRLGAANDYAAQLSMLEVAATGEGISLFTDEALQKMKRSVEGDIMAESLMPGYMDAVAAGTADEFMATLDDKDLTDEAWVAFSEEKKKYDATIAEVENDIRVVRQMDYNAFKKTVGSDTKQESVDAYINNNKWLTGGQINSLNAAMETAKDDKAEFTGMFANATSKKRRDRLSRTLDMSKPTEEVLDDAIALTGEVKTSPSILTNMADNYSDSTAQGSLTTIGNALLEYYGDPATSGVPLPMRDKTRAKTELYRFMVKSKVADVDAEATVNELFANQSEDKIKARKAAWDSTIYGEDSDETTEEYVIGQMIERLEDRDSDIGKTFVADIGWGWFKWGEIKYKEGDSRKLKLSPQMQYELRRNAKNMWLATESTEVAVSGPLNAIRARGAAATDINYYVAVTAQQKEKQEDDPGEMGNGFMIQLNPITKSGNNGEILSSDKVRGAIAKDIKGLTFKAQFGGEKEYSIDEIEVGDGYIATYGPNKGKMQWPLKTMGGTLYHTEGPLIGQPLDFWWGDTLTLDVEQPIQKEAATIVNKIEEEQKPAVKKNKALDRLDFSDSGVANF